MQDPIASDDYVSLYMTPNQDRFEYSFDSFHLGMALEEQGSEVDLEVDMCYDIELKWDEAGDFFIEKTNVKRPDDNNRYFVAYAWYANDEEEGVSEDWNWFYQDIIQALEPHGVYCGMVIPDESPIWESNQYEIPISIDMAPYLDASEDMSGYVLWMDDKGPIYLPYDLPEGNIRAAFDYFGLGEYTPQ